MNPWKYPLFALALGLILSLACNAVADLFSGDSGTSPGGARATKEATEEEPSVRETGEPRRRELLTTTTPFHVLSEDDVRSVLDLGKPDYFDYFDDPSAWSTSDQEGKAAYRFEDGHLFGLDYEPEELYTWWSHTTRSSGNTYAEVSATNGDCIDKDAVGLVVRVDEQTSASGYALEVSCDGEWRMRRYRRGKEPVEMTDWAPADVVNAGPGATNRLGVWAYQNQFVLFINGEKVGEAEDQAYSLKDGTFAVFVTAFLTYDLTATFDDFAFWHIPWLG